jgi:type I restriction enzyme, S subunit
MGNRRQIGDAFAVTKKPRGQTFQESEWIPFLSMASIPQDGTCQSRYEMKAGSDLASATYFERGDVLVAKITPCFENGKQTIAKDLPALCGYATTEVIPLHAISGEEDPRFLFYYLLHPSIRAEIAGRMEGTTARQRVPEEVLLSTVYPAFDAQTQRAIADVLEKVRRAISLETACVDRCTDLRRVVTAQLFTRGLRAESQRETEIGPIPESWHADELGNLAEITYGVQAAVANNTDPAIGMPILTNVNIALDGSIDLAKLRYFAVAPADRDRLLIRRGDVLFNWRSGSAKHVGKPAYFDLPGDYTISSFILRFRPRRFVSGKFLFRYLSYIHSSGFFDARRNVSSINSVYNASLASTIPVYFPDGEEQNRIAAILDAINQKIDLHKRKGAVLEGLFKTLLDGLMSGEISIHDIALGATTTTALDGRVSALEAPA